MPVLPNQVHRDRALENVSVAYKGKGFIADMVFPKLPVKRESDIYYVYSRDINHIPETLRASGGESNQATWNVSTSTYVLEEHSLHDYIPDRQRDNADKPIDLDIDTTEILTHKLLLRREKDLAAVLQDTAQWGNVLSMTTTQQWSSNTTTTNPIVLMDSLSSVVVLNAGVSPNKLVLSDPQFRAIKEHTSVVDRIKYTSPDSITAPMLAKLFNIEEVLVGTAIEQAAKMNLDTNLSAFIWTDCAALIYVPPTPRLKEPSAGYTFWKDAVSAPFKVERWRENKRTADAVQVSGMWQHKPVATSAAYLIRDAV